MEKNTDDYLKKLIDETGISLLPNILEQSIYNQGNRVAIANVIRKALNKEDITICAFGGSITEGMNFGEMPFRESNIEHSLEAMNYLDRVCDFLEKVFHCKVAKINAGIAATDSVLAVHRMHDDVLKYKPDLVIVEWCCNDGVAFRYKQATYECMIRRLLEAETAIMILSMATGTGDSSQILHEPISNWYDVPMVSYRDAYFKLKEYPCLTNDGVHPNIVGHALVAILVINYLVGVCKELLYIGNKIPRCRKDTFCKEALYYHNAKIVTLKDIYDGKTAGIRITQMGSFKIDEATTNFAYRHYYGFTAGYSKQCEPLVIELDECKTMFLQIYRNNLLDGTKFWVELNGDKLESKTFTCKHGSDNEQIEWDYHWATERLCYYPVPQKVVMKIHPTVINKQSFVRLFALLVS